MNASDLYKAGKLQAALDTQIQEVKAKPADPSLRVFLFELAAFAGDLDRARRQIDAVHYGEAEKDFTVARYKKLLDAEEKRRKLFSEGLAPRFLAPAPESVQWRLEAAKLLREGKQAEATALLIKANEPAGALKGTLNSKAFEGFRDADDLFGSVLEVLANGEYFWVPAEQIDSVSCNAPRFPRDLLWLPARLILKDGQQGEVHLPVLYPRSHEHPDEGVKLGRNNDWLQAEGGPVLGVGARTFLAGADGVAVAEWRELTIAE
jgi:type VI secretion system protein ImpE